MPSTPEVISALKVRQWMPAWDELEFDANLHQSRPKEFFYIFSMRASRLRALSGIYRRNTDVVRAGADDLGIQRRHDPERSKEISRYVEGGYPWSTLTERKRRSPDTRHLRKPGWLPTAVVVNLLREGDQRGSNTVSARETVSTSEADGLVQITFPEEFTVPPIEVIDGQHRLFAFDDDTDDDFELPVVAFDGLDVSWQAYLFWTINIKPKKINPSLAFDLYPLLREQDWLESGEVLAVYKESRAQELTEALWSTPSSPWFRRINMLGGPRKESGRVTQAAFIRSLVAAMVKSWRAPRSPIGGIFGGTPTAAEGLAWSRLQQAGFLVAIWQVLEAAVRDSEAPWAADLRAKTQMEPPVDGNGQVLDPAFAGEFSLLASDQGVRGFLHLVNDLCFVSSEELGLRDWRDSSEFPEVSPANVDAATQSLRAQPVYEFVQELCSRVSTFDWRSSGTPDLPSAVQREKAALRGSGGYKELRRLLLAHCASGSGAVAQASSIVLETLEW